jgi:hypothetical protein
MNYLPQTESIKVVFKSKFDNIFASSNSNNYLSISAIFIKRNPFGHVLLFSAYFHELPKSEKDLGEFLKHHESTENTLPPFTVNENRPLSPPPADKVLTTTLSSTFRSLRHLSVSPPPVQPDLSITNSSSSPSSSSSSLSENLPNKPCFSSIPSFFEGSTNNNNLSSENAVLRSSESAFSSPYATSYSSFSNKNLSLDNFPPEFTLFVRPYSLNGITPSNYGVSDFVQLFYLFLL